jgi:fructose-1,6-bisphosphatase/sedoheptulose 1,7-bisphosphatase-like protein
LKGEFGKNGRGYPTVWKVSDVVEGTDFAVNNIPGASSVIAVTSPNGIMPTPEGRKYMMKLIAPPQAKGIMSLSQNHEENLLNLIKKLGIKPEELTQVTLNTVDEEGKIKKERLINQQYIDAARKVGVNLMLINHGDLVPGIKAALDPEKNGNKAMIVIGRSGFEEATMDAAAAKALGGFAECQEYFVLPKTESGEFRFELGRYLSHDMLVPARKEEVLVSVSSITGDNEHFDMPRVKRHYGDKGHVVRTLVVTHDTKIVHRDIYLPD